jgi:hypothetical protein
MNFTPTQLPPGTPEKIELLRQRATHGLPLFHADDKKDYTGMIGGIVTTRTRHAMRVGRQTTQISTSKRKMLSE